MEAEVSCIIYYLLNESFHLQPLERCAVKHLPPVTVIFTRRPSDFSSFQHFWVSFLVTAPFLICEKTSKTFFTCSVAIFPSVHRPSVCLPLSPLWLGIWVWPRAVIWIPIGPCGIRSVFEAPFHTSLKHIFILAPSAAVEPPWPWCGDQPWLFDLRRWLITDRSTRSINAAVHARSPPSTLLVHTYTPK